MSQQERLELVNEEIKSVGQEIMDLPDEMIGTPHDAALLSTLGFLLGVRYLLEG